MAARPQVYPVSLLLADRSCLVVGGGSVALSKVTGLLDAGADVTVIAPDVLDEIAALPVTLHRRHYRAGDIDGFHVVVAATGDRTLEAEIFAACAASTTLVNSSDNPEACTFYLPAILRSGDLSVAISTGGASPAVASWVRDRIASVLGSRFGDVVDIVGATRDKIRADGRTSEGLAWTELIDELTSVLAGGADLDEARQVAAAWLARLDTSTKD